MTADQHRGSLLADRLPETTCGHTKTTGTTHWICTALTGPPPGERTGDHVHYYVNRYPHHPRQEQHP